LKDVASRHVSSLEALIPLHQALITTETQKTETNPSNASPRQAVTKAVVIGTLNPKVAIFFLAFLPQFVDPQRGSVFWQFLVLGSILAALEIVYESVLAFVARADSERA